MNHDYLIGSVVGFFFFGVKKLNNIDDLIAIKRGAVLSEFTIYIDDNTVGFIMMVREIENPFNVF